MNQCVFSVNPEACYAGMFTAGFFSGLLEFAMIALAINLITCLLVRPATRLFLVSALIVALIAAVGFMDGWYPVAASRIAPAVVAIAGYAWLMRRAGRKARWTSR